MNDVIINSIEDDDGLRCVDIALATDGQFWFKEFRRDPEDGGRWTLTADYSATRFGAEADAFAAASGRIDWFAEVMRKRRLGGGKR